MLQCYKLSYTCYLITETCLGWAVLLCRKGFNTRINIPSAENVKRHMERPSPVLSSTAVIMMAPASSDGSRTPGGHNHSPSWCKLWPHRLHMLTHTVGHLGQVLFNPAAAAMHRTSCWLPCSRSEGESFPLSSSCVSVPTSVQLVLNRQSGFTTTELGSQLPTNSSQS